MQVEIKIKAHVEVELEMEVEVEVQVHVDVEAKTEMEAEVQSGKVRVNTEKIGSKQKYDDNGVKGKIKVRLKVEVSNLYTTCS